MNEQLYNSSVYEAMLDNCLCVTYKTTAMIWSLNVKIHAKSGPESDPAVSLRGSWFNEYFKFCGVNFKFNWHFPEHAAKFKRHVGVSSAQLTQRHHRHNLFSKAIM